MDEKGLKLWLQEEKNMQTKSARDVVSRCKRVERELNISLDEKLGEVDGIDVVITNLDTASSSFLSPKVKKVYALAVLRRAVRLYSEYLNR